jgi:hypothetical protein
VRFGFLYFKFDLQPYTWKHGIFLVLSIGLMLLVHQIPAPENFVANIILQSLSYGIGFYLLARWINPAPEIFNYFNDFFTKKLPSIFKKN